MSTPYHIIAHLLRSETSDLLDLDWFLPDSGLRTIAACLDHLRWNERLGTDSAANAQLVRNRLRPQRMDGFVERELRKAVQLGIVPGAIDEAIREWRGM